jgi:hypothetical protein
MGKMINTHVMLVEWPEGKEPNEMPRCRWELKGKVVPVLN